MTKRVRLDSEAQDELDAAVAWYDAQTERPEIGDELLEAVNAALARLTDSPGAFALAPTYLRDSAFIGARCASSPTQ